MASRPDHLPIEAYLDLESLDFSVTSRRLTVLPAAASRPSRSRRLTAQQLWAVTAEAYCPGDNLSVARWCSS